MLLYLKQIQIYLSIKLRNISSKMIRIHSPFFFSFLFVMKQDQHKSSSLVIICKLFKTNDDLEFSADQMIIMYVQLTATISQIPNK
jgi:hypothetical protein